MPINPNIALAVKGVELQDPLAQYGKVAAIQNAQNQNALAQFQLSSAKREDEATNALNAAYKDAYDPATGKVDRNKLRQSLATGGFGAKIPGVEKALGEIDKQALEQDKLRTEVVDKKLVQSRNFLDGINPADPNAPALYLQWHKANHADPVLGPMLAARGITPEQSMMRIQQAVQAGPQAFAQLLQESKLGIEKFAELNKPQLITSNLGGTTETTAFSPLTGKTEKILSKVNTMSPAEAKNVALREREVVVREQEAKRNADPEFLQRKAAAEQLGKSIATNQVAAQQALPGILSNAQAGLDLIDQMVGKQKTVDKSGKVVQEGTAPHPGFANAVGATWLPGSRFVPGTDAAGFQALFEQVQGSAFLDAFNALRGAGAITEKEGAKATAARTRMSLAQNETEFVKAAREYQDVIRKGVENARLKTGGGAPVPAAPATPGAAPAAAAPTVSNW